MRLTPGIIVLHKWSNSDLRPADVTEKLVKSFKLGSVGTLLDRDEEKLGYWNVLVGKDLSQWKEDMIIIAS